MFYFNYYKKIGKAYKTVLDIFIYHNSLMKYNVFISYKGLKLNVLGVNYFSRATELWEHVLYYISSNDNLCGQIENLCFELH